MFCMFHAMCADAVQWCGHVPSKKSNMTVLQWCKFVLWWLLNFAAGLGTTAQNTLMFREKIYAPTNNHKNEKRAALYLKAMVCAHCVWWAMEESGSLCTGFRMGSGAPRHPNYLSASLEQNDIELQLSVYDRRVRPPWHSLVHSDDRIDANPLVCWALRCGTPPCLVRLLACRAHLSEEGSRFPISMRINLNAQYGGNIAKIYNLAINRL